LDSTRFELVLVGGGLHGGLIALAALHADRSRRIALVDAGPRPGGNHTWCLHARDVPAEARQWFDPLVTYRWPRYEVRFPDRSRTLDADYSAITSERFATVVLDAFARSSTSQVYLGCRATRVDAHEVGLDDGTTLRGDLVVDARGPRADAYPGACGFQKFLGLELRLGRPHTLRHPMLMDATVPQRDGYRFFYVLPFGPDQLLIEETYFSRSAALDPAVARASIRDYAARFGTVASVVREESGVLPMPWSSAAFAPIRSPLVAGYRGGWFHPGTGYSAPIALRLAAHLARRAPRDAFDASLARLYRAHRSQARYAQLLNRLLFCCFAPENMWNVFARFYALPVELIHRFYALTLTPLDRARLLVGRPPKGFSLATARQLVRTA
jgi:lycopene beta-cyclase